MRCKCASRALLERLSGDWSWRFLFVVTQPHANPVIYVRFRLQVGRCRSLPVRGLVPPRIVAFSDLIRTSVFFRSETTNRMTIRLYARFRSPPLCSVCLVCRQLVWARLATDHQRARYLCLRGEVRTSYRHHLITPSPLSYVGDRLWPQKTKTGREGS